MTYDQLDALGIDHKWLGPLEQVFAKYDISTPLRQAAFIGQCQHESVNFTKLEESLYYTAPRLMTVWPSRFSNLEQAQQYAANPEKLGEKVYGHRADLGNTEDGDGFKFHGRGIIQLTGRTLYDNCGKAIGFDLINQPQLLVEPNCAAMSAGWFWNKKGLNALADSSDYDTMTKRINGGLLGLDDRKAKIAKALSILG
jgi:putative chitinase